jgi:beta-lactamase superfamily II metal-dependent hydrolase
MLKACIPMMVEDPLVAADCRFKPDNVFTDEERFFLDGPVNARAANNTSLVVEITWRTRVLLFVGDAEQKSWQTMARLGLLHPVDFLKVGHYGSRNATPPPEILEQCLPLARRDQAQALVSTCADNYPGVPDGTTLDEIRRRVQVLRSTADLPAGELYKRVAIPAGD